MNKATKLLLLIIPLLALSHCGRKNNNFLVFDAAKKEPKINKLTLPVVRGVKITSANKDKISLEWRPIDDLFNRAAENEEEEKKITENGPQATQTRKFLGYAVYRFARSAFIPKKPLRKKRRHSEKSVPFSTTKTFYEDSRYLDVFDDQGIREPETQPICYAVRPVFEINKKVIEGPTSKIVCTEL